MTPALHQDFPRILNNLQRLTCMCFPCCLCLLGTIFILHNFLSYLEIKELSSSAQGKEKGTWFPRGHETLWVLSSSLPAPHQNLHLNFHPILERLSLFNISLPPNFSHVLETEQVLGLIFWPLNGSLEVVKWWRYFPKHEFYLYKIMSCPISILHPAYSCTKWV